MMVYILKRSCGCYDDYAEWIVGIYTSKDRAEQVKEEIEREENPESAGITNDEYTAIRDFLEMTYYKFEQEEDVFKKQFPNIDYFEYKKYEYLLIKYDDYNEITIREMELSGNILEGISNEDLIAEVKNRGLEIKNK